MQSQINAGGAGPTAAAHAEQAREQALLKRVMGLSQPQSMMQTISNFFSERVEDVEVKQ